MVELSGIVGIPFLKKSRFTGSDKEKRYAIEKQDVGGELRLAAIIWKGPNCFDAIPDEEKRTEFFEFSEDGLRCATDWINEQPISLT